MCIQLRRATCACARNKLRSLRPSNRSCWSSLVVWMDCVLNIWRSWRACQRMKLVNDYKHDWQSLKMYVSPDAFHLSFYQSSDMPLYAPSTRKTVVSDQLLLAAHFVGWLRRQHAWGKYVFSFFLCPDRLRRPCTVRGSSGSCSSGVRRM